MCVPDDPNFCSNQQEISSTIYEQVFPTLRPRPRRPNRDSFADFLVDEANELQDVFDAGDDWAFWEAIEMLWGTGLEADWATAELRRRISDFRQSKNTSAFKRPGKGRKSPLCVARDATWQAYVRVAYTVAQASGYSGEHAHEVAARILEKFGGTKRGYDNSSIERHLKVPRESVLQFLTIEHASEITHRCCIWFAYITCIEANTLPPKK